MDGSSAQSREEILARIRERIVAFAASRYVKDSAEDLAQEVLMVLHGKYAHVEALEELLPLAFQIMRFKLAAHWRKEERHQTRWNVDPEEFPIPSDAPSPHEAMARRECLDRLCRTMRELGPRCREIFKLKLQGRSFPEIRELLKVDSLNTVYTWDHRCRRELLERMGGQWI